MYQKEATLSLLYKGRDGRTGQSNNIRHAIPSANSRTHQWYLLDTISSRNGSFAPHLSSRQPIYYAKKKRRTSKRGLGARHEPSSPSYKRLSWQIGIIAGILPGIYAGFWLGQNTLATFLAVVLGPFLPFLHLTDIPQMPAYSIPLAFVFYIVCGYLLTQLTGMIRWGVTSATAAGIATTVVSIIVTILIWSHLPNLFPLVTQTAIIFVLFFFITIPAAALGGLLGSLLGKAWHAPWPKPLVS